MIFTIDHQLKRNEKKQLTALLKRGKGVLAHPFSIS